MKVYPVRAFTDNYIWILVDQNTKNAICVDPGEAKPVLDFLRKNKLQLQAILLTHHHYDHIGGTDQLLATFPKITVYGPMDPRIPQVTQTLKNNSTVNVCGHHFEVFETPGHTSTHISYYAPESGYFFCGDTLFSAGCGRVFDGTIEQLFDSINLFKSLPETTKVFCAHEYTQKNLAFATKVEPENETVRIYAKTLAEQNSCSLPSTIQLEKSINPFFRCQEFSVQAFAVQNGSSNALFSVFKKLREEKDKF